MWIARIASSVLALTFAGLSAAYSADISGTWIAVGSDRGAIGPELSPSSSPGRSSFTKMNDDKKGACSTTRLF